jgi:hypothetical protein
MAYADQGSITLSAPSGTVFPAQALTITDLTTGQNLGSTFGPDSGVPASTQTWTVGQTIPAGHKIRATITNVTNPGSASTANQIAIDTSTDTGGNSTTYTTSAGTAVAPGDVRVSNPAPGASGVTYAVEFTTSPSGLLYADQGSITLTGPSGTVFPNQVMGITDLTTGQNLGSTFGPNGGTPGRTESWPVGQTIPAGHKIRAVINNVTNPPTGTYQLGVTTSSDDATAQSTPYTIGGSQPPTPPTVTGISPTSGPAAGGTPVTITGTGFTGATAVAFGGQAVAPNVVSDTQISATSPPGAGTVDVTVTGPGGTSATSNADKFTYNQPPPQTKPPTATPSAPAPTGPTTAELSGTATPNGLPSTAHWEYGLDAAYRGPGFAGSIFDQTTSPQSVGNDFSPHAVPASLTNLVPNALYHARLVVTNNDGTTTSNDQTFLTPKAPAPPAPVVGQKENVAPVGTVFFLENGRFVKLTQARQLPTNTVLDTRKGSVALVAASGGSGKATDVKAKSGKKTGKTFTGTFGGAVFKLTQTKSGADAGTTTLTLIEGGLQGAPTYASCKAKRAGDAHAALSSRILQTLRSRASGRFRTRGRYAAGTVRGTQWTTADRCDGTLIAVQVHAVQVTDFVKHKTVLVRAGHSYLAKAPGH